MGFYFDRHRKRKRMLCMLRSEQLKMETILSATWIEDIEQLSSFKRNVVLCHCLAEKRYLFEIHWFDQKLITKPFIVLKNYRWLADKLYLILFCTLYIIFGPYTVICLFGLCVIPRIFRRKFYFSMGEWLCSYIIKFANGPNRINT